MEKSVKKYWPFFLIPTVGAFVIGFIIPFIEGVYLSFCKFNTIKDAEWVGFSMFSPPFCIYYIILLPVCQEVLQK